MEDARTNAAVTSGLRINSAYRQLILDGHIPSFCLRPILSATPARLNPLHPSSLQTLPSLSARTQSSYPAPTTLLTPAPRWQYSPRSVMTVYVGMRPDISSFGERDIPVPRIAAPCFRLAPSSARRSFSTMSANLSGLYLLMPSGDGLLVVEGRGLSSFPASRRGVRERGGFEMGPPLHFVQLGALVDSFLPEGQYGGDNGIYISLIEAFHRPAGQ